MRRHAIAGLALPAVVAASMTACSGDKPQVGHSKSATTTAAVSSGGAFIRDGLIGDSDGLAFRVQVERVERYPTYAMLRFAVTNTTQREEYTGDGFGGSTADGSMGGFAVVDPVGRKFYHPLREGDEDGDAFGTPSPLTFQPGVRYESSVFFPSIPAQVKQVTVLPPGSFGEMTGIPVVDGGRQPRPAGPQSSDSPRPGQTVNSAVTLPTSDAWSRVDDLTGMVDAPNGESNRSSSGGEVVALRTDVLFKFNSADLAVTAKDVIADIADDMANRADPAQSVLVTGHTDGKGTSSFNKKLSVQRAQTVRDELNGRLSAKGFHFQVAGKGESEPIAKETKADGSDNPEGRARNRRVQISYHVKPTAPAPTSGLSQALGPNIGAPAAFRAAMGPVVAGKTAGVGRDNTPMRLDVHPFFRDGAYLVADFELTNQGGQWVNYNDTPFETLDLVGATYGGFTVLDPNKRRYSTVRLGNDDSLAYVDADLKLLDPRKPVRKYVYYPAPPSGVTSITFDAGPFGEIPNIPIR
jgi:outer membrane protein OmpA-like peptidoglycan-associated protein